MSEIEHCLVCFHNSDTNREMATKTIRIYRLTHAAERDGCWILACVNHFREADNLNRILQDLDW